MDEKVNVVANATEWVKAPEKEKELKAVFNRIIVLPKENPYLPKKTDSGIIMPRMHKSSQTGKLEDIEIHTAYGQVVEVGPTIEVHNGEPCVAVGDFIFYSKHSGYDMEFYHGKFKILMDRDIIAKVTE